MLSIIIPDSKAFIIYVGILQPMSLMKAARSSMPDEIVVVAKNEGVEPEKLKRQFLEGRVVIPHNPIHNPKTKVCECKQA